MKSPYSSYARQLLRSVDLAAGAQELIEVEKFWKLDVFDLFLEECDATIYDDCSAGLKLAKLAPSLAERVISTDVIVPAAVLRVRAYCRLGSAYRACGDFPAANQTYDLALAEEKIPGVEAADLYRRLAYLRLYQGQGDEAERLISEAIRIQRLETDLIDRHELGRCLVARATIRRESSDLGGSILDLTAALNHLDVERGPRPYFAAAHNLAVDLVAGGSPSQLSTALQRLTVARKKLRSFKKRHYAKYKLKWLQGLIQTRFGATAQAELSHKAARRGLIEMGAMYEVAMISLDLAALYLPQGRIGELRDIASETWQLCSSISLDTQAIGALRIWYRAIEQHQLTLELLASTRVTVAVHTIPAGSSPTASIPAGKRSDV